MGRYYRLGPTQFMKNPLDGVGSALAGGRWNSKGTAISYCCDSRALCCLEVLVHVTPNTLPRALSLAIVDIPDELIKEVDDKRLKSLGSRAYGDNWVKKASSLGLLVPCAVIPEEMNLLINPNHKDAKYIKLETVPFSFDKRIVRLVTK